MRIPDMSSAIIAMAVCYGAYMAEIIRAGIQAIPHGQMEAALALGLSRRQAMRHIILPQTIKIIQGHSTTLKVYNNARDELARAFEREVEVDIR